MKQVRQEINAEAHFTSVRPFEFETLLHPMGTDSPQRLHVPTLIGFVACKTSACRSIEHIMQACWRACSFVQASSARL